MDISRFIVRRIRLDQGKSFTRVIVQIAIVAVAISLSIIILASSLIAGFKQEISSKVYGFWGHINISHTDAENAIDAEPISLTAPFLTAIDTIGYVEYYASPDEENKSSSLTRTKGGIRHVQPYINLPAMLATREQYEGMVLRGVGPGFDWTMFEEWIEKGKIIQDDEAGEDDIVISRSTARRLKLDTGSYVLVSFFKDNRQVKKRLEVTGIYNTGLEEYDKRYALVNMALLQDILGWQSDQVAGFELFVDDIRDIEVLSDYIYIEVLPAKLYAESIQSRYPNIFEWLNLFNMNERFLFIVLVVVAFINMVTVLIILIMERTTMIGIMKAVGSTNQQVQRVFLRLAMRIILKGLIFGNLFALILGFLQWKYRFISLDEDNYYLSYAPIAFDPIKWAILNAGAFLLILLFLIVPTFLILRIQPVKALRFS